ncbi:C3a anaphylatoxin chemotactic receptor-like [Hyla sarda]|uniref:C3a anaphylatoxin chemotactic receptor-like n=1 Tax=Hyla sarda TaxID=327740 RepID=UPI0024C2F457|nr:C3a anaphylatoxin chemotactic receptor-like [Hyla sarda]
MALTNDPCYSIVDIRLLLEYHDSYSSVLLYFNFVMSIITCLVGLVGNAVVICFLGFIMKKPKSRYWFLNLSIADFFFLLTLPLQAISDLKGTWTFGPHMCKLSIFCLFANMYASILILIGLNIARVLSVAQPMFHHKFISQHVSFWVCILIWFIAILFSLPVIYYSGEMNIGEIIICNHLYSKNFSSVIVNNGYNASSKNTTRGNFISDIYTKLNPYIEQCSSDTCCGGEETLDSWNHMMFTSKRISIPFLIIGYFIPLGIVIICNITIAVHVRKSKTVNPHRLYQVVLVIIMMFFITWTPAVIAEIMLFIAIHNMNLITMFNVFSLMPLFNNFIYANSCLNPIVYVLTGGQIRSGLSDFINSIRNKYI